MITKKYNTFLSADGVHHIHYFCISPEKPRAIIQVEHGVAEHIERYVEFAYTLAEQGYAVFADDHLGHGKSVQEKEELCWFAEQKGWQIVCKDIWHLHDIAVKSFPNIPYFLMGHSMGSFLARTVAIKHSEQIDGLILSGTGHQSIPVIMAGKVVCAIEKRRIGSLGRSKLINQIAFGSYNKVFRPNRTRYDWLTRDEAEVNKYLADPLCGVDATVGLFGDMLTGFHMIGNPKYIIKMRKDLPVYIFSGDKDPVGNMGKGVETVCRLFQKSGLIDVTMRLYEEGRHELLNGPDKELVVTELLEWVGKHLQKD